MTDAMGEDQLLPVCIVDRFLADVDEIENPIIQSETLIDVEIFSTAFVLELKPLPTRNRCRPNGEARC